ncbi:MAG: efflux RND transporter permease subunit [Candidatus Loosdrechtia sp.]|uniref:efflux RND transporter permease subunit n=1 Tax=Candidatus Loosdrechtia sp. TaxID=3101272 RepID=UPI003A637976|nr:MAG: efflux RND transporter permease subunit [Candidatus Jettenia sp. AMX2]
MDIVSFAIKKPVTVIVGVIFVVLFGIIGLKNMPYQLTPTVIEPEITVTTTWKGATPHEVEREIIEEQEKVLKGTKGLVEMESESFNGSGRINLKFAIGTRIDDALLRVSNKLNEVPSYPENVDRPIINATGANASPVIWMILNTTGENPNPVDVYRTYLENDVLQYLERVEGVADLFVRGGREKEMHIIISPERLAAYGITIKEFIDTLQQENINISAGNVGVGRRDYRIRSIGEFNSVEDIENVVIKSTGQKRILLSDIAKVNFGYEKPADVMMRNGRDGIALGVVPEPGTNILDFTDRVEEVFAWLNSGILKEQQLQLEWVYDQRPYIKGAIRLVRNNIFIGGILAVIVLLVFLRSVSSTIIITTSIPISILGTFIFMSGLGRNLNVISLAGISFAVGMLVDNAIVVLENIDRHRKMEKSAFESAYQGTKEVWGAILASTLTTIAVFLPIVFIQEEAGQLFRDIAIAVTFAVALSLFVSVFVIPMFSKQLFSLSGKNTPSRKNIFIEAGNVFTNSLMKMVRIVIKDWRTRLITILLLTAFSILSTVILLPKMEYLPQGNRNLVISVLIPPPGLSYQERREIGEHIYNMAEPFMRKDHNGFPGIQDMFYIGTETRMFFGARSIHEERAGELVPLFREIINSIPGMHGISMQAQIFETQLGKGRTIDVDISSHDLNHAIGTAFTLFGSLAKEIPGAQIRPVPSLEILYPEIKIIPDRDRLMAVGMNATDFGIALDIFMDGRKIGDFKQEGHKKIDLIVKASTENISSPEVLYNSLLVVPEKRIVPIYSLAGLERTTGISSIRHLERNRTVSLQVTPPDTLPLQEAMEIVEGKILQSLYKQGILSDVVVAIAGAADKLTETKQLLQWNFILAIIITYLLMSSLFGNFIYPFIILFTVPLAAAGGFIGLQLVNIFITSQPFDVLTMLGFVILIGIVVNNAILIVHQALNNIRYHDMDYREAVLESTRTRLRPIYMSASTSVFGMLPLVIAPGPGSELYRGLGSVVLGGLALSTIFTVFLIPAILMFFIKMEKPEKKNGNNKVIIQNMEL